MNTYIFGYSQMTLDSKVVVHSHKHVTSQSLLGAQIHLLMFLNKCNKDGKGKSQFWCDHMQPVEMLSLADS